MLPVRLEITPPGTLRPKPLLRRASVLRGRTRRIHVIERPGRLDSLTASALLRARGYEPVWHVPNRGRSFAEIESAIGRARRAGICHALCVRGEYKRADRDDTPKIREVVRMLQSIPGAQVGVTFDPFASRTEASRERALRNLRAKLRAGAAVVQAQVSFELESLRPFAEVVKSEHPQVEIWPMLMPVETVAAALRVSRRLQVPLPPALVDRLERFGSQAGWEHASTFARGVADSDLFAGVTLMTPIDPSAAFERRLREALAL